MDNEYKPHDDIVLGFLYNSNDMPCGKSGVNKEEVGNNWFVKYIRVCAQNKSYENQIESELIKYCKPPRSDIEACENSKREKRPFNIFVMSGTKNYYYGKGIFLEEEDVNSRCQRRYFIKRISRDRKNASVCGMKRRRDVEVPISVGCSFEGEYFPSLLEARYAKFFKIAGIEARHELITVNIDANTSYIPDFYVSEPFKAYIEIKPEEPPLDAMMKCESTCRLTGMDVYLFFKHNFAPPYDIDGRAYNSSKNIRAYRWYMENGIVVCDESKHSFVITDGKVVIDKCIGIETDRRFFDKKLIQMYKFDDSGIEKLESVVNNE